MEEPVQQRGLKRELRVADLVLMQVLLIVGLAWVGTVGVEGSTHVFLWLAGIVLFYLPLGAVVISLSRAIPIEGGAYQWVKTGISPFAGYLAAWNNSFYTIVSLGTVGPGLVNSAAYIAGPRGDWMMSSTALILGAGSVFLLAIFAVNFRGLHLAKWITGSGSVVNISLAALMFFLLAKRWMSGIPFAHPPFSLAVPAFSILTLNLFTKTSIGALAGFDSASVFAGECYAPDRDLPRSVMLSAPLIAAMYIFATGAMLAYVPPEKMDLAAPLPQLMRAGFTNSAAGEILVIATVCVLNAQLFSAWVALAGMTARFPMVIGWDGLLPDWWSDLHPRFRTPVKALAIVTGASMIVALVSSSGGAGGQEIYQIGIGGGVACLCIYYALLFSVVAFGKVAGKSPVPLRLAAVCGFLVSAAALPFQIVPIIGVSDRLGFAVKVGGLICAINAVGAWLYWRGAKRLAASQVSQPRSIF
jgi:glutamate:GABA antiporter